jgi:ribonuclease HI
LVVKQVTGDRQTNEQHFRELRDRARDFAEEFETFEITWVDREENLRADQLVVQAFDTLTSRHYSLKPR